MLRAAQLPFLDAIFHLSFGAVDDDDNGDAVNEDDADGGPSHFLDGISHLSSPHWETSHHYQPLLSCTVFEYNALS